jgi:PIN domain nuclease of toxin-antitoxin system
MTSLLLDTCAAIYLLGGERMTRAAIEAMDAASDLNLPLQVSPITAWEVGMLGAKGRFKSSLTPQRWLERLRSTPGIQLCDLTTDVLLASSSLPGRLHRDPADRIMAATAREFGFTLVTRDDALLDYGKQGYLSVLKC